MCKRYTTGLAISMAVLFSGCKIFDSPERRDQRRDVAALQRVMAKKDLADKVFNEQAKLHPCSTVITQLIPGKTDSLPYPVYQVDKERLYAIADSLRNQFSEDFEQAMKEAADAGYAECQAKYKAQKIPAPRVDTFRIEDTRKTDAYRAETLEWKQKYTAAQAALDKAEKDAKGKLQLQWWMAIIFPLVFILIGYLLGRYAK